MNRALLGFLAAAFIGREKVVRADPVEIPAAQVASDSLAIPHLEWSATYASWYSFQGIDYSQGLPVLQPGMSVKLHGVSLGLWSNLDQSRREWNEVDVTLQAEREVGPVTCGFGYAYLRYPHRDWAATHELIAELGLAGSVQTSLSVHWDVAAGHGRYWALGLSRDATFHAATASLGAKVYVHEHYYDQSGFPALETSVAVSSPWACFPLQPSLSHLWAWPNGDFRGDQAIRSRWIMSLTYASP